MHTVYAVYKPTDFTEGRGPSTMDSVFANKEDAAIYMDYQPGVMGRVCKWSERKYGDWFIVELKVYDNFDEFEDIRIQNLAKSGLAKLSEEEKLALGLLA